MLYQMTVKTYLAAANDARQKYRLFAEEYKQAEAEIYGPRAIRYGVKVKQTPNNDKMIDDIERLQTLKARELAAFCEYIEAAQRLESEILALPYTVATEILIEKYINGATLTEAARTLDLSTAYTIRQHGRGLQMFAEQYGLEQ